jgi:hypothetical protein
MFMILEDSKGSEQLINLSRISYIDHKLGFCVIHFERGESLTIVESEYRVLMEKLNSANMLLRV